MSRAAGLPVIRQEWRQLDQRMSRLQDERDAARAERDEARRWCAVFVIVICITAMALGYALANVPV